jgi:mono/diheme cytochrome c family protein
MRFPSSLVLSGALALAALTGCRGQESEQPPIHYNPNMDSQPRYDPQAESKFYEDRRTMRQPVEGTVARGNFLENDVYATGKDGDQYVAKMPIPITEATLKRGQQRYNIYCTPCHDASGSGKGLVVTRGYPAATNLNEAYSRTMADGQVYGAIAYGIRNMPSYAAQIPVDDRWAIVAYVRALQFSQNATAQDVPADKRGGMTVEAAQ